MIYFSEEPVYKIGQPESKGGRMKAKIRLGKASIFFLGVLFMLAVLFLTGANHGQQQDVGRYRMSVSIRGNFTDIYVIDTTTGVVKYLGKDEGKPFELVGGK